MPMNDTEHSQRGREALASFTTSAEEQARTRDARYRDRRVYDRFEINAPGGCLCCQDAVFPCEIVDVSLIPICHQT